MTDVLEAMAADYRARHKAAAMSTFVETAGPPVTRPAAGLAQELRVELIETALLRIGRELVLIHDTLQYLETDR
jgi:hypothetical protein